MSNLKKNIFYITLYEKIRENYFNKLHLLSSMHNLNSFLFNA
jgi:hypothetical protein